MKFGCCASAKYADMVARLGFDYIELPGRVIYAQEKQEFTETEKMLDAAGIRCLALNLYCPPEIVIAGKDRNLDDIVQYARALAQKAGALGVECVGIGSPRSRTLPEGYDRSLALRQTVDFLKATSEEFAKYGITVCVESLRTYFCNFINTIQEASEVVKAVDMDNCRIVADFYNMEHVGEGDISLEQYLPLIAHAHVSDDYEGDPQKRYFLEKDKAHLHTSRLANLRRLGYDKKVSLEIDVPPDEQMCADSLKIMRDAMK